MSKKPVRICAPRECEGVSLQTEVSVVRWYNELTLVSQTSYIDLLDISRLQTQIMVFVQDWVRKEKTPVPLKNIVSGMETAGTKTFTTVKAIKVLLRKGYIRRAFTISNKTYFVQLRTV